MPDQELPKNIHFGYIGQLSSIRLCLNDFYSSENSSGENIFKNNDGKKVAEIVINPNKFYLRVLDLPENKTFADLESELNKL